MKTIPLELMQAKGKLLEENILPMNLLEALLYNYSKYAKLYRDEAYKLRGDFNRRFKIENGNGYIKPATFNKLYEYSKEYEKATPKLEKMREYYDNKELLIKKFLKPVLVHYIETKYKDSKTGEPQLKYFSYYITPNGSYHLPEDGVIDGLELVKLPELLVDAAPVDELLPVEFCDELMEYISKNLSIVKLGE